MLRNRSEAVSNYNILYNTKNILYSHDKMFCQSHGYPIHPPVIGRVPIRLDTSGRGPHAIGRSMGWTESWTLSDN